MDSNEYIKLMADMVAIVRQAMADLKKDILDELNKEVISDSPKYSVGDLVYFSVRGYLRYGHIEEVSTYNTLKGTKYVYVVNVFGSFYEHELFDTTQDLARQQVKYWGDVLTKHINS